jgi:eukaryotic-like serine/threonine-protein kinase
MPLAAGEKLASYEIVSLIGAGGMGEVYRARDPRVGRDVAIKISAERFTERFEREARAIASLNHPNICTLFDVGPNYLVMELVEGEPPRGPMPVEEAIGIARQIAAALEAAHEKGITHRDLKPANILIRPDGTVKVLDFGLAKMGGTPTAPSRDSPTISLAATEAGVILGTAAYMSPEQARGKPVDQRADIWAFGVVLYEMLTGKPLFQGEDITETLAAVIKEEPELGQIAAQVRRLLKACLQKDPNRRLQAIGDMRLLLEEPPAQSEHAHRSWLAWGVAAAGLLIAAGVSFVHFREQQPVSEPVRFQIFPPEGTTIGGGSVPLLSPDGRRLVFIASGQDSRRRLWVHSLDSLESQLLPGTEDASGPFWSPDSRFIGFSVAGKLRKLVASGGAVQTVIESPSLGGRGVSAAWNTEGVIIFGGRGGLSRVSEAGGAATALTVLDTSRGEVQHVAPNFLPDGRHFLYLRASTVAENSGIYLGSLDAGPDQKGSTRLLGGSSRAVYVPALDRGAGHLLFVRDGTLTSQAFDNRRLELIGTPVSIAERVGEIGLAFFSASANGVLAYRRDRSATDSQLTWFDREGKLLNTALKPGLLELALSPDGTRVAGARREPRAVANSVLVGRPGIGVPGWSGDVWFGEFERGTSTRFTSNPAGDGMPVWSPDGKRMVFASNRDGPTNLYQKATGGGNEEPLFKSGENKLPLDWSRDGRFLLYSSNDSRTGEDLWVLPLKSDGTSSGSPAPFLKTEFNEGEARFSPDARWIAYRSNESGRNEVYVQSFPTSSGGKHLVSNSGGSAPHWRRDGRELFYLEPGGQLMAAEVTLGPEFKVKQTPKGLFVAPIFGGAASVDSWAVTSDGQRFLVNTNVGATFDPGSITVVLNWQSMIKK